MDADLSNALAEATTAWEIAPEIDADRVAPVIAAFPRFDALPGASVIKENHFRTVCRLPAAGAGLIGKVYRYPRAWDRWRFRFLRSRARQEWHALRRFRELGLAAPPAVAVTDVRDPRGTIVGGGLLLGLLPGVRALHECLEEACAPGARRHGAGGRFFPAFELSSAAGELYDKAGRQLRRMHDAGVWHRDMHAGNLLLSESERRLYFVDLHSCVFLPAMPRRLRLAVVAKLFLSLAHVTPPRGLEAFLEAYGAGALAWPPNRALSGRGCIGAVVKGVRRRVDALERTRVRSRSKRCFKNSTRFRVVRGKRVRLYHRRPWPEEKLASLWAAEAPPGDALKSGHDAWVAAARLENQTVCVKYRRFTWAESLRSVFEGHRLRRAYAAGHAFWVHRLPSPEVIALRERTFLAMVREAHLVTEFIAGGVPLDRYLFETYWGQAGARGRAAKLKHRVSLEVGRLIREVHRAGVYPHDVSPQNVLACPRALEEAVDAPSQAGASAAGGGSPCLYLLDLDHVYLWQRLSSRGRMKNLIALGNLPEGHVTVTDRLRAFRAYQEGARLRELRESITRLREGLLREHLRTVLKLEQGE